MGGKHKQANRTKNNTRPSNSSHSAELLGNTIPTFFGFSSVKNGVSTLAGFPVEDTSCSINSDFQVLFKQMNKKDPTTRFKALQLFRELVNNSDTEAVNAILPLWPRLYCMLCTDLDHKVREVSHKAHRAIVSKVKKMIAPYLKELAGPWFTSQYDTYAPAASAATLAFEEAFPSSKLNKAITFCQEEILSYIYDNLINQTPQKLSNPMTTSPEDMQAKYERTILVSLQGYTLYLEKLSEHQIQEAEEKNKQLLSNPKFWKYAKNKIPLIRSSFFHTLVVICQNAKFLFAEESSRLSSVVFNSLDESDPIVLQSVWNAALNVLLTIDDCWLNIKIEKQFFEKLYTILKGGGRNVFTIYPSILPLLSKLPEKAMSDKEDFYKNLFESMRCGLIVNSFNPSASEGKLMATTFIECLKYTIIQNNSKEEFCSSLISEQLMSMLDKLLRGDGKGSLILPFLIKTSCLIHYWDANRSTENSTYDKLISDFFLSLSDLYSKQIASEVVRCSINEILINQIQFLIILLHPDQFKSRSKNVKFEEESESKEVESCSGETTKKYNEACLPVELIQFTRKLVALYFKSAIEKKEKNYLSAIVKIGHLFGEKIVFEEMMCSANESACFKLFSSYFSKWLTDEEMKCGELIDLSLLLPKYVTQDEKEYILEELSSDWLDDSLRLNVCRALPNYSYDDSIMRWAKSEKFTKNLIALIERFAESEMEEEKAKFLDIIATLLKTKINGGEFIIDASTTGSIMDALNQRLEHSNVKNPAVELSRNLILQVPTDHLSGPPFLTMVALLFKLSCYKSGYEELFKSCRTGLRANWAGFRDQKLDLEITKKLSEVVREIIVSDEIECSLEKIVANVNAYVELAVDSTNPGGEAEKATGIIKKFLEKGSKNDTWIGKEVKAMEKCCRVSHEGNGNLDFDYLEAEKYSDLNFSSTCSSPWEKSPEFDLNMTRKYVKWNLYAGSILDLILSPRLNGFATSLPAQDLKETGEEIEEVGVSVEKTKDSAAERHSSNPDMTKNLFWGRENGVRKTVENLLEDISDFSISVCFLECFIKYHAGTKYYRELKESTANLKKIGKDLFKWINFLEFELVYNRCKASKTWPILEPIFRLLFGENFEGNQIGKPSERRNLIEESFSRIEKVDISKLPIHRGYYLTLFCFIENEYGHRFTEKQWDGIFIYMHRFFEESVKESLLSESDLLILSAISRLYLKLKNTFSKNHSKPMESRIHSEACLAWNELVRIELYGKFFLVWKKLAEEWCHKKEIPPDRIVPLEKVSDVVLDGLEARSRGKIKESLGLAVECSRLMTSPHSVIQITAFRICISTIPDLVKLDAEIFGNNVSRMFQDGKEDSSSMENSSMGEEWTIKHFRDEIVNSQGITEILLSDFFVGDYCAIEPFTDSFTYTYSYLLLWCFLLNVCGEAHSSLRVQYGIWLREPGYTSALLESVFKLMPQAVLHGPKISEDCQRYFERESLDYREPVTSKSVEQMACLVYRLYLEKLPNHVRDWWKQAENKTSTVIDKVTRLYVSPILISNELKSVQQDRETGFDNIEIKTYPGSREVVASYTIDEIKMDLNMTLPPNYPLGTAKIECSNVVVGTSKWRNLLFQICKYLIHQNGTIWDALVIWKNNLDKKFEGVEECYICFSILQGSSFEIPRLCCHTCKKKFHSNCLYKWFSTSNKSTCPICRNLF